MPDLEFSWIDLNFMTAPAFFAAVLCIVNSLVIVRSFNQYIVNGPPKKKAAASPKRGSLSINSSTYDEPSLDAKEMLMGDEEEVDDGQSRVQQTPSFQLVPVLSLLPAHLLATLGWFQHAVQLSFVALLTRPFGMIFICPINLFIIGCSFFGGLVAGLHRGHRDPSYLLFGLLPIRGIRDDRAAAVGGRVRLVRKARA